GECHQTRSIRYPFRCRRCIGNLIYSIFTIFPNESAGEISDDYNQKKLERDSNDFNHVVSYGKCLIGFIAFESSAAIRKSETANHTGDGDNNNEARVFRHCAEMNFDRPNEFCPWGVIPIKKRCWSYERNFRRSFGFRRFGFGPALRKTESR